ncbi:amino acid adenylation domain-containing protein [Gordonia sp. NPDC003504]
MSVACAPSHEPSFPASAAAQGLWAAQSVIGPSPVFTIGQLLEFDTRPDAARLIAAATAAAREADLLSARFSDDNGELRFHLGEPIEVRQVDLGPDPSALNSVATTAVGRPIDPAIGPCAEISVLTAGNRLGLLIVAHHMVLDAYGLGLLVRRIARLYDDLTDPQTLRPITDLPAGVDDARPGDREFWERELADASGPVTLAKAPRGHRIARRVRTERVVVGGAGSLTRTPAVLAALIAAHCARLVDSDEVILGFPMMNRLGSPAAMCACSTVNVIPLRVPTHRHSTLSEVATDVAGRIATVSAHARYRGEDIVRDLRRRGIDGVIGPTLNIKPFSPTAAIGGHVAVIRSLARGPVVDVAITCADLDGDLEIVLDADADLYDNADVADICSGIGAFVAAATRAPTLDEVSIGAIALPDEQSAARAIAAADEATRGPIDPTPLVQRVLAHPDDAVALICGDERIDVATLRARVTALSDELGVLAPEDIVAVALPRGVDMIVALLAVHHSGAAFLPLDPGFPAERLAATMAAAAPVAVIEPGSAATAVVRVLTPTTALPSDHRGVVSPSPEHPAYVIYTSGSTGTPKGVVIGHRALANFGGHLAGLVGYRPGRRVLSVTTISFDIAILETLVPLAAGATVVLATSDDVHDPARLAALIGTHRIDIMQATPSLWSAFLESGHGEALTGVDVLVGGEALPADIAGELTAHAASVRNMYGPTETTIWSTTAPLRRGDTAEVGIGTPIANTGVRILDSALHPASEGDEGELYLSGAGLARGYHGRPDLTCTRFVADPFGPPGARMYRTGDLARRGHDGMLYCLGRTDHQVKIRGFRIELGDIDAALAQHHSVERAVTVAVDGRLVGHAVPARGHQIDAVALRRHLSDRLPDYMIPAAIAGIDVLPLTPNGKIDRAALPRPDFGALAASSREPSTDTERALALAFRHVLGIPAVGVDDDFFVLGGDSLTAVRVVAHAARAGVTITPIDLFDHPTVTRLATVARVPDPDSTDPDSTDPGPGASLHSEYATTAAQSFTTAELGVDELDDLVEGDLL